MSVATLPTLYLEIPACLFRTRPPCTWRLLGQARFRSPASLQKTEINTAHTACAVSSEYGAPACPVEFAESSEYEACVEFVK